MRVRKVVIGVRSVEQWAGEYRTPTVWCHRNYLPLGQIRRLAATRAAIFGTGDWWVSRWSTPIDSWIRMCLRSILRRRHGRRGRGRGRDHQRWPNAYFVTRGLFLLTAAYAVTWQSSKR